MSVQENMEDRKLSEERLEKVLSIKRKLTKDKILKTANEQEELQKAYRDLYISLDKVIQEESKFLYEVS